MYSKNGWIKRRKKHSYTFKEKKLNAFNIAIKMKKDTNFYIFFRYITSKKDFGTPVFQTLVNFFKTLKTESPFSMYKKRRQLYKIASMTFFH